MRVMQVCHDDSPPFPAVCRTHSAALAALGAHVTTVYLTARSATVDPPDAAVLSRESLAGWTASRMLGDRLAGQTFDAVIAHRYKACVAASLARRRVRADRLIVVAHEFGFFDNLTRRVLRRVFARAVETAAVSRVAADELSQSDPLRAPSCVLPNVVDLAELDRALLTRAEARAALSIPEGEIALAVVGRLNAKKDPRVALHAFAAALRGGSAPAVLHYLGAGNELAALQASAAGSGIADCVRFHGFVPDAARSMVAFDALLFPSIRDSFGMVLIEAMAAGLPVLAADSPVAREVLGALGRYFEHGAPESASAALRDLLTLSAADRSRWRRRARERIVERYSVAALSASYAELLGMAATHPAVVS